MNQKSLIFVAVLALVALSHFANGKTLSDELAMGYKLPEDHLENKKVENHRSRLYKRDNDESDESDEDDDDEEIANQENEDDDDGEVTNQENYDDIDEEIANQVDVDNVAEDIENNANEQGNLQGASEKKDDFSEENLKKKENIQKKEKLKKEMKECKKVCKNVEPREARKACKEGCKNEYHVQMPEHSHNHHHHHHHQENCSSEECASHKHHHHHEDSHNHHHHHENCSSEECASHKHHHHHEDSHNHHQHHQSNCTCEECASHKHHHHHEHSHNSHHSNNGSNNATCQEHVRSVKLTFSLVTLSNDGSNNNSSEPMNSIIQAIYDIINTSPVAIHLHLNTQVVNDAQNKTVSYSAKVVTNNTVQAIKTPEEELIDDFIMNNTKEAQTDDYFNLTVLEETD